MEFKMNSALRFACAAVTMTVLMMQIAVAQDQTNHLSDQQSIELGNVDGPDEVTMPANLPQVMQANAGVTPQVAVSGTNASEQADNKITGGASNSASAAATPMERYRDLKLQQAATSFAGNPSTIRRYLKVDRSAFADSDGVR
jgi:hypothetical protein